MQNIVSFKESKKRSTIVLHIDSVEDKRNARALAILLGWFNPSKNEIKDREQALKELQNIKDSGEFDALIQRISKTLK